MPSAKPVDNAVIGENNEYSNGIQNTILFLTLRKAYNINCPVRCFNNLNKFIVVTFYKLVTFYKIVTFYVWIMAIIFYDNLKRKKRIRNRFGTQDSKLLAEQYKTWELKHCFKLCQATKIT